MFVTAEYLVYYRWLTNQYDCPVNVYSLYETCTTAVGCSLKKFLSVFVMGIIARSKRDGTRAGNQIWSFSETDESI